MRLALISRIDDHKAIEFTSQLRENLEREGVTVVYDDSAAVIQTQRQITRRIEVDADAVVVIGGDGTVLRTVQLMVKQIPIIGINWGEVGFLTDLEPDEALPFLLSMRHGFSTEKRMRISIASGNQLLAQALNEAVIVTSRPAKMLRFSIFVDNISAGTFRADGMVISTPTGSTAYAMSAGGPIVDPNIEGFLLVPLAPYMLSSRPWLVSCERPVEIRLVGTKPAKLVVDGQQTWELTDQTSLVVGCSPQPALFVDAGKKFFNKVENKLHHL